MEPISRPYDTAGKKLIDLDPISWVRLFRLPGESATILDSDLTVGMTADRLIRVFNPDGLIHIELVANYKPGDELTWLSYHVGAEIKLELGVKTVVVLMRKEADHSALTGLFDNGEVSLRYQVIRIWKYSAEDFLTGPISLMPLALISDAPVSELPGILLRMQERTQAESLRFEKEFWLNVRLLLGLRMNKAQMVELMKGVDPMLRWEDSSAFADIVEEGKQKGREEGLQEGMEKGMERGMERGMREMLLAQGRKRLGEPNANVRDSLERIHSSERLAELASRVYEVESWSEVLA